MCFSGEDRLMYFIKCIQNCFACWENFKLPYPFFLQKWTYFIPCVFSDILQFESEFFFSFEAHGELECTSEHVLGTNLKFLDLLISVELFEATW